MIFISVLLAATALSSTVAGVPRDAAAQENFFGQMATCQESWFDWKDDEARMTEYGNGFSADFTRIEQDAGFLPKGPGKVLGFPLIKVYPQSVGMGVGFSVQLGGRFDKIRSEVEHRLGKSLDCSAEEGMTSCIAEIGENRNLTLMTSGDGADTIKLLGCYYYYQQ